MSGTYHVRKGRAAESGRSYPTLGAVKHLLFLWRRNLALDRSLLTVNSHRRVAEPAALLCVVNSLRFFEVEGFNAFCVRRPPRIGAGTIGT